MTTAMQNACVSCNYITIYLLSVDTCTFRNRLRQLSDFKQVMEKTCGYSHELERIIDIGGLVASSQFFSNFFNAVNGQLTTQIKDYSNSSLK